MWVELTARSRTATNVTVRWGPYEKILPVVLTPRPEYLLMDKRDKDAVPVHVDAGPAAAVRFGQGKPPSGSTATWLIRWTTVH